MGKKNEKKKNIKKSLKLKKTNNNNKKKNENEDEENNNKIENNDSNDDNICIICLCQYDKADHKVKTLKCNHTLCENCFEQWYQIKESCPICRKNLFPHPNDRPDFYKIVSDLYLHNNFFKHY